MGNAFTTNDGNNNTDLSDGYIDNIILFELSSNEIGLKISNLVNELNSRGLIFSVRLTKTRKYLIIYNFNQISLSEEKKDNLLRHLISTYSLKVEENLENFFIPDIKKVEQEGKILTLIHGDNSKQYVLACQLASVDLDAATIVKRFTHFTKDLIQANVFSVNISQFVSREKNQKSTPSIGVLFISRSHDKNTIKEKEKILLRYLKASSVKLDGQLLFLSKRDITRHKINFQYFVPWLKLKGLINSLVDVSRLLPASKIEVPANISKETERIEPKEVIEQITIPKQKISQVMSLPFPSTKKPYHSIRSEGLESTKIIEKDQIPKEITQKYSPSKIDDLTVPAPRTMNAVFDAEYLKVRISKTFKNFEFKESLIFEENFDLVLRKESSYVFVKFFKDILTQDHTYKIIENLSSIAGLRSQFLCIAVADVVDEISKKLLNEYNILHLTVTDVLVSDKLKEKIYGTVLA